VERTFDLPLMTQMAVGSHWNGLSADQKDKLIEAFRRFTVANYVSHFDSFAGQRFQVEPAARPVAGGQLVQSQLVLADRKRPVELDYMMREVNGRWRAVDVYAEGTISELARRRSEFTAVLTRSGADALVDRLVERAQTLINEPA